MATAITDEMCIEAARELARCAEDKGISEDYIIPTMEEWEVFPREAAAVGQMAIKQGLARIKLSKEKAIEIASIIIKRARAQTQLMTEKGLIAKAPI
jgi:malate dehydrogenase (oxaloacetate-decarboxylating)